MDIPPIRLREIEHEDLEKIHAWRLDSDVSSTTTGCFRYANRETEERWFDAYQASRDNNVRLAIVLQTTDEIVGVVYLLGIDWISRSATLGLMVGEKEHWGEGIGSHATRLAVRHAFEDLNLHRLELQVLEDHERARRAYENAGFVREGLLKDAVFKNGGYQSLIPMALVRDEGGGS